MESIRYPTGSEPVDIENGDENELNWAAIERLPTIERLRTALFDQLENEEGEKSEKKRVVNVTKLDAVQRRLLVQNLIKHITDDNLSLLQKQRERLER